MPTINVVSWNSRTNIISIKWVNHNGWIDIFVIKKKLFFCSYFFHIQWALPIEIWVKTQGDMSKIRTQKVVFLWQICQFNHYGWLIWLEFYWFLNSNSQELIVGVFSYKAHFRPQISSNVSLFPHIQTPLMQQKLVS